MTTTTQATTTTTLDETVVTARRLDKAVAALHRRLAVRAAAVAATAWLAGLGWLVVLLLVLSRLVPSAVAALPWLFGEVALVVVAALILGVAGVAAWRAASRVTAAEAARYLDGTLGDGRFTVYTTWEWAHSQPAGALLAVLRRHLAQLLRLRDAHGTAGPPELPRWPRPILGLVALTWLAVAVWFAVALEPAQPRALQAEAGEAPGRLEARLDDARQRAQRDGDEALAQSAAELHAALQATAMAADDGDGLAAALARAERLQQHRRAELERQAVLLEALDEAQQTLATNGEISEADWERMRASLVEKAQATQDTAALEALTELALEDAADVLAELAQQQRAENDRQAAVDAQWQAILDEVAAAQRQREPAETRSERQDREAATTSRQTDDNEEDASSESGNGTIRTPPSETDPAVEAPSEPLILDLTAAAQSPEPREVDPADAAALAPQQRALANRLARWQQQLERNRTTDD